MDVSGSIPEGTTVFEFKVIGVYKKIKHGLGSIKKIVVVLAVKMKKLENIIC